MSVKKYRPSLNTEQITQIIKLARLDASQASISVLQTLAPFEAKITNDAISASHEVKPKVSLLTELGGKDPDYIEELSRPEYNLRMYKKYTSNPEACSVAEIEAAKEHMYINDLMSPEQEAEYEATHGADDPANYSK